MKGIQRKTTMKRVALPHEIANVMAFLVSLEAYL